MALSKDIVIRLLGDAKSAVDAQKAAADAAEVSVAQYRKAEREFDKQQKAMDAAAAKQKRAMQDVGQAALGFGAVVTAGLGMTVKAAMDWESAWAGVTKTVSGTPAQLREVETGLRNLARTLPASHTEIAAVAEAAGQLGVQTDSVVEFTRTMVNLGETTNLSADEAATSLAQLMNVMRTAPEDVDNLGSALVALGNDGASTEADIMRMASYLSGAGALINASESDVLALANTLTSMGVNAERGGGVMTRVMQDVYSAVQMGGEELDGFAKAAGMSSAEFARAFEADPIRAIGAFTDGLGAAKDRGDNVIEMLGDLGYKGTQDTAVLLQLASAQGDINENLDLGAEAWRQNTALVEEAAKRYDTTAAKLEIARNGLNDAAIEIGETFLPVLADLAGGLADVAGWFADLPDPIQGVIGGLTGVAGVGALAGGAFLLLAPRVMETYKAFQTLTTTMPGVASGLGKVGKAAGIAGVIAGAAYAVDGLVKSMGEAPPSMEETTKALLSMGTSMEQVDAMFQGGGTYVWSEGINGLADAARALTAPGLLNRLDDFGGSLTNIVTFGGLGSSDGRAERAALIEQIDGIGNSLGLMVQSGNAELAADQFDMLAAEWERGGGTVDELLELMPVYKATLGETANEQEIAAESARKQAAATAVLAQDLETAYGSIEGYAAAMGYSEDATEELIKKTSELGQSLADFINPLGVYTGMLDEKAAAEEEAARKAAEEAGKGADSWRDFVVDTGFSFDEYMRRLEEQVTAQTNWQTNMLVLAGRVSQGTLNELARMGPEGAPLVADLVKRSDAELDRFDDITALRSKEATNAWGAQLTLAAPVLAEIARKGGQGAADAAATALASGTATLGRIASDWGVSIAGGINPILKGLGKPQIDAFGTYRPAGFVGPVAPNVNGRPPGFVGPVKNADGNLYEDHTAQIAPGGAWRVWAEPETGGEAYIPLASSKRARSLNIWRETGKLLDAPEVQHFAFGGISDVPRPPSTAPFGSPFSTVADSAMQKAYDETTAWLTANLEPPATSGGSSTGLMPIMAAARQYVMDTYGVRNIGGFARRNIAGTNTLSDHGMGKAIDIMTSNGPLGWSIANDFAFGEARKRFNIENTIWQQSISSRGGPFKRMADRGSITQNHYDHIHADTFDEGGLAYGMGYIPKATVAPERVLSPRQTVAFESAMRGLSVGAGIPVGAASTSGKTPAPVVVRIDGARITGRLEMGTDGVATLVDGRIVEALTGMGQAARNGVRS